MSVVKNVALPEGTPDCIPGYLQAQKDNDFSNSTSLFSDDIVFNGLLFKLQGRESVTQAFKDFVTALLTGFQVEAVARVPGEQFMVMQCVRMLGMEDGEGSVPVCDLVTVRDGVICRIDNCFNVDKVPQAVKDAGAAASKP